MTKEEGIAESRYDWHRYAIASETLALRWDCSLPRFILGISNTRKETLSFERIRGVRWYDFPVGTLSARPVECPRE